jgi:hypothetical protein
METHSIQTYGLNTQFPGTRRQRDTPLIKMSISTNGNTRRSYDSFPQGSFPCIILEPLQRRRTLGFFESRISGKCNKRSKKEVPLRQMLEGLSSI